MRFLCYAGARKEGRASSTIKAKMPPTSPRTNQPPGLRPRLGAMTAQTMPNAAHMMIKPTMVCFSLSCPPRYLPPAGFTERVNNLVQPGNREDHVTRAFAEGCGSDEQLLGFKQLADDWDRQAAAPKTEGEVVG